MTTTMNRLDPETNLDGFAAVDASELAAIDGGKTVVTGVDVAFTRDGLHGVIRGAAL